MTASYLRGVQRAPGTLTPSQFRGARLLFYAGWIITLLYFPSGLMHALLGRWVYFRDILLLVHLTAAIVWLYKTNGLASLTRRSSLLMVPAIFMLPALANGAFRVEAATYLKWTAFWVDWIIMGRLAVTVVKGLNTAVIMLAAVTALLLVSDLTAGLYERVSGTFLISGSNEVSAFGVEVAREGKLGAQLRIKGLQRDVFSFANIMAMSAVTGLLVLVSSPDLKMRFGAGLWTAAFGIGMFTSGGRSAFFGVFAAALAAAGLLVMPATVRQKQRRIVFIWLLIALLISFVGVGKLTESIGGSVMSGSDIGDSRSAYMRDANWNGIRDAIKNVPIVLASGAPLASMLDPGIDPIFHWADNQYMWLLYHTGVVGFAAMVLFFANALRLEPADGRTWLRDALLLYLLFVMGEAIARESFTFIGCMPLFVACGCLEDNMRFTSGGGSSRPPARRASASAKGRSDAADFSRRIREAERRRG